MDTRGDLLQRLEKSAQTMRHTAESVENRGLKLLLKVMARERVYMFNTLRQALGKEPVDPLDASQRSPATSMQQGLQNIQTGMTVQRGGRETLALSYLVEEEAKLLSAYDAVLGETIPDYARLELEAQRARVAQFYARIAAVDEGADPIIARVFDTLREGEDAVARLKASGLDESQIDAAPFTQMALPSQPTVVSSSSPKNTVVAGAYTGAIVGGIAGLALAVFVWMAPQLVGWVTVGGWTLLIAAILIGAVFGAVFGLFIGQSRREDDIAVTADSLINGEILVVAYPQPQQVPVVEEILQTYHERELNR
ncbi:MAG: hypothetical protein IT328_22455 [Caldilineaceae bacterium]|nr:hypothetical protein [Caldilineaceae bacterium]